MDSNQIFGVRYDDFASKSEFLRRILAEFVNAKSLKQSKLIAHLNVHSLNLAYTNKSYGQLLNRADILFFDSIGLKLVANLFLKLRVSFASTPPEWMHDFFLMLPVGTKIFFIGDEPTVIENYNTLFFTSFPQLKSVGYHHGYFLSDPLIEKQLIKDLKESCPDIVLVGMGMPIQEFWIERMKNKVNVPMYIPVGAYFQRMIGVQKRPPEYISRIGMEWLYRLGTNPKGLFKRYIIGNSKFLYRVIRQRFMQWGQGEIDKVNNVKKKSIINKDKITQRL